METISKQTSGWDDGVNLPHIKIILNWDGLVLIQSLIKCPNLERTHLQQTDACATHFQLLVVHIILPLNVLMFFKPPPRWWQCPYWWTEKKLTEMCWWRWNCLLCWEMSLGVNSRGRTAKNDTGQPGLSCLDQISGYDPIRLLNEKS